MTETERQEIAGDDVPARPERQDVLMIAADYLDRSRGDAEKALLEAIADGMALTRLVSRGYARWGKPPPRPRG